MPWRFVSLCWIGVRSAPGREVLPPRGDQCPADDVGQAPQRDRDGSGAGCVQVLTEDPVDEGLMVVKAGGGEGASCGTRARDNAVRLVIWWAWQGVERDADDGLVGAVVDIATDRAVLGTDGPLPHAWPGPLAPVGQQAVEQRGADPPDQVDPGRRDDAAGAGGRRSSLCAVPGRRPGAPRSPGSPLPGGGRAGPGLAERPFSTRCSWSRSPSVRGRSRPRRRRVPRGDRAGWPGAASVPVLSCGVTT